MQTIFGENLDRQAVLSEYPRPQMYREPWLCLNGAWEYAITQSETPPDVYDGEILVPFSPESALSGVGRTVRPQDVLWYRRMLELPAAFADGRVLLHFGAVDQRCDVFVNGVPAGSHVGGYTAFMLDVTDLLAKSSELVVRVRDSSDTSYHSRGKQKTDRGGIWYTPQSGIWQTVWCERVPQSYIGGLHIVPLYDASAVCVTVLSACTQPCAVTAFGQTVQGTTNAPVTIEAGRFEAWSPEHPKLYALSARMGEDAVESYFGMRKIGICKDVQGVPRIFLNNAPYYMNGVLDQGYWPDGLYTAPSDEAMIGDIKAMKALGFNMLRKHIKIEPLRWYYHCDRLGMLVWQEMVNGGGAYKKPVVLWPVAVDFHLNDHLYGLFARGDAAGRAQYYSELRETVLQLRSAPSVVVWVPFNEGWGQFDSALADAEIRKLDATRLVDRASGWHDQGGGDFRSRHVYFRPYRFKRDRRGRAVVLSEFGGYTLEMPGHTFGVETYGYKDISDKAGLAAALCALFEREILPAKRKGLCASVYTQLSDVEDELNGLLTYDRRVNKLEGSDFPRVNRQLSDADARPATGFPKDETPRS
ncbi:MAG: glycoside hydrolase family 2 TIM barrel-domain containing protein [Oscillospiraceae bacterium]|nr:glycoside hydrolase family 2 TIM barrel-domain containing protein [Oscillospiraceae bacterium]